MSDVKFHITSFHKNLELWLILLFLGFSIGIAIETKSPLVEQKNALQGLALACWPIALLLTRQLIKNGGSLSGKARAGAIIFLTLSALTILGTAHNIWLISTSLGILSGVSVFAIGLVMMRPILDWQLMQDILLERDATDIQRNFISLLSHNLNTPIAKLAGTLGVLEREQTQNSSLGEAKGALKRLQFYVRGTLQTATLLNKDHKIIAAQPLATIIETISEGLIQLKQFNGQDFRLTLDDQDQEMLSLPLYFDGPQISQFIAGALFSISTRSGQIDCHLENLGTHVVLIFTVGTTATLNAVALMPNSSDHYLASLCKRHIAEILKLYRGSFVAENGKLIIRLQALTPGNH